MMRFLYNAFIASFSAGIAVASYFNTKVNLLYKGRKHTFHKLEVFCAENKSARLVWFHCASLGEYEQGKPLIQKMKSLYPDRKFVVSFFSPSGYEIKKNDADIDCAVYLPSDSPRSVRRFLDILNPESAFFVKYEYWYNFMNGLYNRQIPFYYLSAIFRPTQYFFKPYGKWFSRQLKKCSHFFVQNDKSRDLLHSLGINQVTVAGDTRFDRVYAIAQQQVEIPFVRDFKNSEKLLVAGSTWPPDENVLHQVFSHIKNDYKLIIAPHVIDKEHILNIKKLFERERVICYTEIEGRNLAEYNVLIIDAIGFLSKVYRYADVAHIGGAFATGLHNTLEAGVFGIPLFFGPHYDHFNEAVELVERGGAFAINNAEEMLRKITDLSANEFEYQRVCAICKDFVQQNLGACNRILEVIR